MLKSMAAFASLPVIGAVEVPPNFGQQVGALFDNITIPPLFLLLGGVVLGVFLARKFPNILPTLFAPKPDVKTLIKEAIAEERAAKPA